MPTEGPCCVEDCTDPDNSSGQWQYIPENYCIEHILEHGTSCTCKKVSCLRKCGLRPEKRSLGRKRNAADESSVSPNVGVALEEEQQRPPIIISIDEIWNERCAASCHPLACCMPDWPPRVRSLSVRCVNLSSMVGPLGAVARGNKLAHARSRFLEYAVHGKWRRSENDANGLYGAWYISVRELVETFGAETVTAKLSEYAAAQAAARQEAVDTAIAGMATEPTPVLG